MLKLASHFTKLALAPKVNVSMFEVGPKVNFHTTSKICFNLTGENCFHTVSFWYLRLICRSKLLCCGQEEKENGPWVNESQG